MSDNCLFCKIVKNEIPAVKIYEDDDVLAFMDIMPVSKGHILIIPKIHSESLLDADPSTIAKVAATSVRIANAAKQGMKADGVRVMQLSGAAAGQTVFHYHMHIMPVMEGDGFNIHGREQASSEVLQTHAKAIKRALNVA